MAEIAIVGTAVMSVTTGDVTVTKDGTAGATILAGQWLYLDSATSTLKLAQSDGTAAEAAAVGIALNGGASGQPIRYATGGTVTVGSVVAAGVFYFVSSTAGNMELFTDIVSTEKIVNVCYATAATIIKINIVNTGLSL